MTYYISPTGSDSTGDGSQANPWATIAKAYTSSALDDTIFLESGTYDWLTTTMISRTFRGSGSSTTFIDAGAIDAKQTWKCNLLTFEDITFQNNGGYDQTGYGQWHGLFTGSVTGASAIFNRCVFTNIFVDCNGAGPDIQYGLALFGNAISATFTSCVFWNIGCNGVYGYGYVFVNRFSSNNSFNFINCSLDFASTGVNALTSVIGNFNSSGNTVSMKNTIINNRQGAAIQLSGATTSLDYCDYYNFAVGSNVTVTNSTTDDPLFVDANHGDFRLRQNSPCLNTGTLI